MDCIFQDNVVDYFISCLIDIEKLEMNTDMFNKVNNIYYDGCPHLDDTENHAVFRLHWCYNKEM
jgi:hypothetical protein